MKLGSFTRAVVAVAVVTAVAVSVVGIPVVSAAGETTVSLDPASSTVETGDTQTVGVVVDDADGGVGAYNVTVSSSDPSVASIVDATPQGDRRVRSCGPPTPPTVPR